MFQISTDHFDKLARQAFQEIPNFFKTQIENVSIVIEEEATNKEGNILGLYQGYPKTSYGGSCGGVQPSKITLYQKNLERYSESEEELYQKIKETLMHEIGHYFGYDEKEIQTLENRKNNK